MTSGNVYGTYDFGYQQTGNSSIGDTRYADWDGDFSKYGSVTMVDITIPEPSLEIPDATPASLEAGMAAMVAARDAGGGARFASLISTP